MRGMETKGHQPGWMNGALAGVAMGVAGFTHAIVPLDGLARAAASGVASVVAALLFLLIFSRKKSS